MREPVKRPLVFASLCLLSLAACATIQTPEPFEIYLVRHAEKAPAGTDPGLTGTGSERALWLGKWLASRELAAVWSSDYRRTRQTALPAAQEHGLALRIYDPRQLEELASVLRFRAETALVVGHSNTTPELAALLCECTVAAMAESEYDRIIVVSFDGPKRDVRELDATGIRRSALDR